MTFEISRVTRHAVFGLAAAALALAACGGKPAEDASTARDTATADSDPGPKDEAPPPPRKAAPPPPLLPWVDYRIQLTGFDFNTNTSFYTATQYFSPTLCVGRTCWS